MCTLEVQCRFVLGLELAVRSIRRYLLNKYSRIVAYLKKLQFVVHIGSRHFLGDGEVRKRLYIIYGVRPIFRNKLCIKSA